jgi:hypothetical protein
MLFAIVCLLYSYLKLYRAVLTTAYSLTVIAFRGSCFQGHLAVIGSEYDFSKESAREPGPVKRVSKGFHIHVCAPQEVKNSR